MKINRGLFSKTIDQDSLRYRGAKRRLNGFLYMTSSYNITSSSFIYSLSYYYFLFCVCPIYRHRVIAHSWEMTGQLTGLNIHGRSQTQFEATVFCLIIEAQLSCLKDPKGLPFYQKFNNGAIYVNNQEDEDDEMSPIQWKNGMKNF
jgi:hypothetical protein